MDFPAFEGSNNAHMDIVDELMSRGEPDISIFFAALGKRVSQKNLGIEPCSIEAVLHSRRRSSTTVSRKRKAISMEAAAITDEVYEKKVQERIKPKVKEKKFQKRKC